MICWGLDRTHGLFDVHVSTNGSIGHYYNHTTSLITGQSCHVPLSMAVCFDRTQLHSIPTYLHLGYSFFSLKQLRNVWT